MNPSHLLARDGRSPFLGALAATLALGALPACSGEEGTPAGQAQAPVAQTQPQAAQQPAPVQADAQPVPVDADGQPKAADAAAAQIKPEPRPDEGATINAGKQAQAAGGPTPRLESDVLDHDFGKAIEGQKLAHAFKLKSAGQADLIITAAKPTCGCTVAKLELRKPDGSSEVYKFNDPLPPGVELELQAELDTKNKHNQTSSKINIYCNDPRQIVTLGLTAMVDTYFAITPNSIQFGDMSIADTAERTFEVAGKKQGNFMLSLEPKTIPDGMKIDLVPVEPDAQGKAGRWTVKVTMGPGAREGSLGYPVTLRSDEEVEGAVADKDGKKPTYGATVMVTARVQGLISFDPQYLSFGLVRPGQIVGRSLTLKSFDPNFTFGEGVKARLAGPSEQKPVFELASAFATQVKLAPDGKSATVELTLNGLPENVDGSFQARLIVETGHPQKPEVQVLFSGVCRPGVTPQGARPPVVNPPADAGAQKPGGQ